MYAQERVTCLDGNMLFEVHDQLNLNGVLLFESSFNGKNNLQALYNVNRDKGFEWDVLDNCNIRAIFKFGINDNDSENFSLHLNYGYKHSKHTKANNVDLTFSVIV